jgi:hypothetical protein
MSDEPKVFKFPTSRIVRTPSQVDSRGGEDERKKVSIDIIVDNCLEVFAAALASNRVDFKDGEVLRMFGFSMECLRAAAYRGLSIDHPLHALMLQFITEAEAKMTSTRSESPDIII